MRAASAERRCATLLRLADEELVEIFPQSGTFVSRIPIRALPAAILVRKALEEMTARLAAQRAEVRRIGALHDLMEGQRRLEACGDRDRFHEADEAFHAAIADAAGHPGICVSSSRSKSRWTAIAG